MGVEEEVSQLREAVATLTEAVRVLSEKDDRAQSFITKVEELLALEREAQVRTDERLDSGN